MEQLLAVVVIPLLGCVVTVAKRWMEANLTPRRLVALEALARTAVFAADEVGNALNITSAEKYEYAENALTSAAKRVGFRLKPEEANAFIHSVLNELHSLEARYLDSEDEELLANAN